MGGDDIPRSQVQLHKGRSDRVGPLGGGRERSACDVVAVWVWSGIWRGAD